MSDSISRQDVLNLIKKWRFDLEMSGDRMLMKRVIKAMPSAQSEQRWIPCNERLPETTETVLITHKNGVSFGWYNGRYWERGASTKHIALKTVSAWMPLPEPYREGDL